MPEIGETLREARMRRRIDMAEVETATKIRAKYLRALENEEWDLLPGPTFVKSFLRTYAEYLGLDPRLLVEEYRQRYERPSSADLAPFAAGGPGQRRRRRPRPVFGPVAVVVVGVLLLVGALYLLGTWGQDDPGDEMPAAQPTEEPRTTESPDHDDRNREERERPKRVRLRLEATGDVYVCLVDARGRQVIDEETLSAGDRTRTFRSRSFRANFGSPSIRMRVGGKSYPAAMSANPIGYRITPGRRPRRLADSARPDCSS